MNRQIVHNYNIASLKAWQKDILHIFPERLLFERAFNCCGLHHAFQSDCGGDTVRFPASRCFSPARVATQRPAITRREIRPYTSFIEKQGDPYQPLLSSTSHVPGEFPLYFVRLLTTLFFKGYPSLASALYMTLRAQLIPSASLISLAKMELLASTNSRILARCSSFNLAGLWPFGKEVCSPPSASRLRYE